MLKKILSVFLVAMMLLSVSVPFVSAQETTQVADTSSDINEARENLGELLDSAVKIMSSPDINTYPSDACEKLEQAMGEAYGVYYNPDATLQELNAQAEKLSGALANMKKPQVSEDAEYYLASIISQAETQVGDEINYTSDSWAVFTLAFSEAKRMQAEGMTDSEVIAAANNLKEAIDALELIDPAIVSAREYLYSMIDFAYKTLYSGEKYTEESVNILLAEINTAETLYYNPAATVQELYFEADKIVNTINLMEVYDISEEVIGYLSGVIAMADSTVGAEEDYTAESWLAYKTAYSEAVKVLNTGESEEEYLSAANDLGAAVTNLVPVDKNVVAARENLWAVVNLAHQILSGTEKYTTESQKRLESAIDSASAVGVKENATEPELIAEKNKVQAAIDSLEKIVVSEEIRNYLSEVIAMADTNVDAEEAYTADSWSAYKNAYLEAVNVLSTGESEEEFIAAANALGNAIEALVRVDALLRVELYELIESARVMDGNFTAESLETLRSAITEATAVYEKEDATVQELTEQIEKLTKAIEGLEVITTSYEAVKALENAIASADEIDTTANYTSESLEEFLSAYENAKTVYETGETDKDLKEATERLLKAIESLKVSTVKIRDELFGLIKVARDIEGYYTPESLGNLYDAISEANDVYFDRDATYEEISEQIAKLLNALDSLEPDIDAELEDARAELYDALHSMPVGGNYTYESIGRLDDAITAGWAVYDNPDATVEEIREQTSKIQDAFDGLEGVYIDADVLNKLWSVIERAEKEVLDEKDYTAESWAVYSDAIFDAYLTYYYGKSDEDYLSAAQRLSDAIDNLKPAYKKLILGDVDQDGKVTIKDATLIQKSLAGIVTLEYDSESVADANCDGVINIKDATEIQKHLASLKACEDIGKEIQVPVSP